MCLHGVIDCVRVISIEHCCSRLWDGVRELLRWLLTDLAHSGPHVVFGMLHSFAVRIVRDASRLEKTTRLVKSLPVPTRSYRQSDLTSRLGLSSNAVWAHVWKSTWQVHIESERMFGKVAFVQSFHWPPHSPFRTESRPEKECIVAHTLPTQPWVAKSVTCTKRCYLGIFE